ncbi:Cu(I)-responsive transcriptional regulator [Breoghania sp. L-A4]|uniref:Cu(I)-responsive transcriptional regulator n=1 Tax=Breoghania sp. L-A4 TaxID=2304600 RepID=UPI000E35CCA7|nr:Cu(I)-responsive transcriptional regulator [Breoghania sp. L-A4]AXS41125.1 Cu(I)-responsive transcriptional regulator [Breoghania sp. L-A4]
MNIGEAAEISGLPPKTIRYYEDIGLLTPARRGNGYRDYAARDVHKLSFLRRARSLGFVIEDCRQLLSLYEDKGRASASVKTMAEARIHDIDAKILELEALRQTLSSLVSACHGDDRPDCPILDDLAGLGMRSDGLGTAPAPTR